MGSENYAQQPADIIQTAVRGIQQNMRDEAKAVGWSKRELLEVSTATCFYMFRTKRR